VIHRYRRDTLGHSLQLDTARLYQSLANCTLLRTNYEPHED